MPSCSTRARDDKMLWIKLPSFFLSFFLSFPSPASSSYDDLMDPFQPFTLRYFPFHFTFLSSRGTFAFFPSFSLPPSHPPTHTHTHTHTCDCQSLAFFSCFFFPISSKDCPGHEDS